MTFHLQIAGTALSILVALKVYQKLQENRLYSSHSTVGTAKGDQQKETSKFDIIVVGGGTSGCVLASRLSEASTFNVLLLDAGGSGAAVEYSQVPSGFGRLFNSPHAFSLYSEPQVHARGRKLFWPRGKMLGGCSSLNAMMAQYGAAADFDEWAKIIKDESWSWKSLAPYFTKFERFVPHNEYPDIDASAHGLSGPVKIGYFNSITETSKAFAKACVAVGVTYTADFLGNSRGVSRILTYMDEKFHRVSSETAYLTPQVLSRPNLTVVTHAQVLRIIFEADISGQPKAVAVEYAKSKTDRVFVSYANKEILLSAGAVHSPHILLLSGIGPEKQLKEYAIPLTHDLPGVGSHLRDHPIMDMYFKDKTESSFKFFRPNGLREVIQLLKASFQYKRGRGGPLASNFGECAAFVRSDDPILFPPTEFPDRLRDTSSAADSPDLELFSTPFAYKDHGRGWFDVHTFALHCYLLRPASLGTITLKSSNPWDSPRIHPNYLDAPEDAHKLARGVRLILKIAQTEPLASYLDASFIRPDLDHETHLKTDEELLEVIYDRFETVYHPTSTCRMATLEEDGVVDSQLRVYGVQNLRVCDASIFPEIVSGHTSGACYAVAEKLSDMIKRRYA